MITGRLLGAVPGVESFVRPESRRLQAVRLILVTLSFLTVGAALLSSPERAADYWYLYYSPVLLAAITFGLRGALVASVAAIVNVSFFVQLSYAIYSSTSTVVERLALLSGQSPNAVVANLAEITGLTPNLLVERLSALQAEIAVGATFPRSVDFSMDLSRAAIGTSLIVCGSIVTGYLVDQNRQKEARLRLQAATDSLTGLLNHGRLVERLQSEISRALRYERSFALLLIDVDHFKRFNDEHGHLVGDEVLREVAQELAKGVRTSDVVGRYGGEEFALLLLEAPPEEAMTIAERLRGAIAARALHTSASDEMRVTVSIGVALCPEHGSTFDGLLGSADEALYRAKRNGRNLVCLHGAEVERSALECCDHSSAASIEPAYRALGAYLDASQKDSITPPISVVDASVEVGRGLGLESESLDALRVAMALRDVGKLALPDGILRKPGPLTPEERSIVRTHPVDGALMLGAVPRREDVIGAVLHHHERWDGTGYPDGLAGEAIPLLARVVAVVDAYAAMTAERPYRRRLTPMEARAELESGTGTQFDPAVVQHFVAQLERRETAQPAE
ncbi:MAG: diguanylate cyclase [Chloroflexi bacterium]|nr:diguanylate cyclase [Chloroflexota bacterium]